MGTHAHCEPFLREIGSSSNGNVLNITNRLGIRLETETYIPSL